MLEPGAYYLAHILLLMIYIRCCKASTTATLAKLLLFVDIYFFELKRLVSASLFYRRLRVVVSDAIVVIEAIDEAFLFQPILEEPISIQICVLRQVRIQYLAKKLVRKLQKNQAR